MQFTTLGHTGLTVSRICLGCMSYGTSRWRPWVLDESDALPFYRRALDAGINFFDTADMYSLGATRGSHGKGAAVDGEDGRDRARNQSVQCHG